MINRVVWFLTLPHCIYFSKFIFIIYYNSDTTNNISKKGQINENRSKRINI
jgi:hypothetical protein